MKAIQKVVVVLVLMVPAGWGADAKAGKSAYDLNCRSCHGADGTPDAMTAKIMKVEMKDLRDPSIQAANNDALKKTILEGKGKMKPVAGLSAAAVENVIAYVKTLKK